MPMGERATCSADCTMRKESKEERRMKVPGTIDRRLLFRRTWRQNLTDRPPSSVIGRKSFPFRRQTSAAPDKKRRGADTRAPMNVF